MKIPLLSQLIAIMWIVSTVFVFCVYMHTIHPRGVVGSTLTRFFQSMTAGYLE